MEGQGRLRVTRGGGTGALTVSRQAGQRPLGLGPAVLELGLDLVLVAGDLPCGQ